ncbi:hypothetical protein ABIC16_001183 [Sphingomonas sp. PvP055]|uniref:TonB-dependent receptor n=1 Tax=Sphingomonas sp. PvP055 TaxID=3156391 RepID=UPI00339AF065
MRHNLLLGAAVAALIIPAAASAQETTSTIRGTVTASGAPVAGAKVSITNSATGTVRDLTTDAAGTFNAPGLPIGGPYTVGVTSAQGNSEVTDVFTVAGQPFLLPVEVGASEGPDIVVTASRVRGAGTTASGPTTVLTANDISKVASVNRDIRDLMRRDPFATLDTSSTNGRQVTFAGQNPRFNRFTIDGVPITDSFGLNPDALPSRRGPVPLDSIGQFETKVAPYDIREGFFQGGVINAVLRSGTNSFQGTGFYTQSSDGLTGNRTRPYLTNTTGKITQPKFKSEDYGAELSGPIIKDKLFFMIAGERVRAAVPLPYGTVDDNAGQPVNGLTSATVNSIVATAKSRYGYDAGGIVRTNGDKDDRLVGKLSANLSNTQRLTVTGIYTKDALIVPTTTATNALSLASNAYTKPNEVYAGVGQLNSDWGSNLSTEVRGLYKRYTSGQVPLTGRSAQFAVCTAPTSDRSNNGTSVSTTNSTTCASGVPQVQIGAGGPSQTNILRVTTYGGSFLANLRAGDHNLRLLTEYQHNSTFNAFVNPSAGTYYFDSIADFNAGNAQSFSYNNAPSLNPNDAAANFSYSTYTFGLQDDWKVTSNLNVSAGLRYDLFGSDSRPTVNPVFFSRYGFSNASFISGRGLFQPRFSFDYRPVRHVSVRGGVAIFGAGSPDVYSGNSFSNTGIANVTVSARQTDGGIYQLNNVTNASGAAILRNVNINTVPAAANTALQSATQNNLTSINALAPNFKLPSQLRSTLSINYDGPLGPLGDGWNFGVDGLYSKVRNQVIVTDIRSVANGTLTPDGRPRYSSVITSNPSDTNADYLLTNTTKGVGYVGVIHARKDFDFGLGIGGSYTYQWVKDAGGLTSSQASSIYGNGAALDPNFGAYGHSNDEVRSSFKYNVSFEHAFIGDYKTRLDLFGETRSGSPYSYTFQDNTTRSQAGNVFGTVSTNARYLFYVPTVNDAKVVYANAATQSAVEALITSTGLKNYRGQIAPRNGFRSKWFTKIDLHLEQQIPTFIGKSRVSVFADIENALNLINSDWGQQLRANFPYSKAVVRVSCIAGAAGPCSQYQYSNYDPNTVVNDQLVTANGSSLYSVRLGARFSF